MKQIWVLQGNSQNGGEWLDLFSARKIKQLPNINADIARSIGAIYRIVQKDVKS